MNNLPTVTKNLLIINVLCFFGMLVAKRYGIDVENLLGLHFFLASDFNLSQLISYMFMHANFQHIFFNMFAVWMFGRVLEQVWGPKRFLTYYLICGIGAGLIQELVQYLEYAFIAAIHLAYVQVSALYGLAFQNFAHVYAGDVLAYFRQFLYFEPAGKELVLQLLRCYVYIYIIFEPA